MKKIFQYNVSITILGLRGCGNSVYSCSFIRPSAPTATATYSRVIRLRRKLDRNVPLKVGLVLSRTSVDFSQATALFKASGYFSGDQLHW